METKFQTSFIPKKPMPTIGPSGNVVISHPKRVGNTFMLIGVIIFVLALLSVGGAYLWQQHLQSVAIGYGKDLATREQQFNIDLISQLKASSVKIGMAKQLLANHLAYSKIFAFIGQFTAENVQFTSMEVTAPSASNGNIQVTLSGYGLNLSTVAFQSDVLSQLKNYDLDKVVKNPIVSAPVLNSNGTVTFTLSFSVVPSSLSYAASVNSVKQ